MLFLPAFKSDEGSLKVSSFGLNFPGDANTTVLSSTPRRNASVPLT